jgi:hypothetical protein
MAIHIQKTRLGNQINVSYHKIVGIPYLNNVDAAQTIRVQVSEYVDIEAAKTDGLPRLWDSSYEIELTKAEIISYSGNIYALIYSKLMALPEFEGSTLI